MRDLEAQFDRAMKDIYVRAKSEANYNASIFYRMLCDHRGLATAKYLINERQVSDGYTALWERDRLDLTVEAEVVDNPKWYPLFTDDEVEKARRRLRDYGYSTRISESSLFFAKVHEARRRGAQDHRAIHFDRKNVGPACSGSHKCFKPPFPWAPREAPLSLLIVS